MCRHVQGGYDMIMYGDSLTDGWSWSTRGLPVFEKFFGMYRVLNAGITGATCRCEVTAIVFVHAASQRSVQQYASSALLKGSDEGAATQRLVTRHCWLF